MVSVFKMRVRLDHSIESVMMSDMRMVTYDLLVRLCYLFHRIPGRYAIVRTMIYSGVMLCYGFRDLAIGPVTVYGVML